ncbi:pyocin knob domain-containing protein [Clostridium luticellarii]|uniref:Uncharacterized protein n=1 Tax=Clostridium luticellarii TaxID=1691940 RepID=A0A2T0BPZ8_9CLOT|nr:pyocin knob domain-containing protein [Clostridium luticellarii]PRR85948.1 hypothetical protein CLLU_09760 [Clostridium luticellarii]
MAYPDSIDKFIDKLNKLDNNTYVIEEKVEVTNGVYEGELEHDNISLPSINVYTGSKLTGTKIENVIVSTPSLTPWKNTIKIFSTVSPVYISYQTQGDTVEAEDINKVQDSVVNTQTEVDRYKDSNDNRVTDAENRISTVENNKAEKTYVDTELNKRYLKSETYTKTETDQRIQLVVDAAPEALDTLKEIADSLNNDPDFAATITTALSKKVDKVDGKQLSTEDYTSEEKDKLAGIEDNANKYVHPTTHPGSMITEDSTHRWTTDTEKSNWNDANSKKHTHNNLSILQSITQALIDAWNSAVDHISDTVKHITSAERTLWNTVSNKVNKSGDTITGQLKIQGAAADRPLVIRGISGATSGTDDTPGELYLNYDSDKAIHIGTTINIDPINKSINAKSDDSGKLNGQDASYYAQKSHTHDDRYYTESESDNKFATKDELEGAGYGDMLKSVYDKDNDGVVDKAEDSNTVGGKSPDDYYARRGELSPSTDFNTILKPGCYKVQMSNWDSAVNSPNSAYDGLYSFGLLVVHRSSVTEEDRVLQVYYPHRANQIPVRRMLNSGGWQSWSKIVKGSVTWNDLKGV